MFSLGDLFKGFANSLINSAKGKVQSNVGIRKIENLCNQLGWSIDGRMDDSGLVLNFSDPTVGTRQLLVTAGESGRMAFLSMACLVSIAPDDLPNELGYHLLMRNKAGVFHSWQLCENTNGRAGFIASYCALVDGLDPVMFKVICDTLLKEVHEVDNGLRSKGYM